MPMRVLHQQVASIALDAISGHGFALAGGNALIAHGLINRPTQDVDLFTDQEGGVEATIGDVEHALTVTGFQVERRDKFAGLAGIWDDLGVGLAEWVVTSPQGEQIVLQTSYYDRACRPVAMMDIGPVLALEDAVGSKCVALATRAETRDILDVAMTLVHYSIDQIIAYAVRLDPGLRVEDFTAVGQRLDAMPDDVLAFEFELDPAAVAWVRSQFAKWPRD